MSKTFSRKKVVPEASAGVVIKPASKKNIGAISKKVFQRDVQEPQKRSSRRALQTLQPSTDDESLLVGLSGVVQPTKSCEGKTMKTRKGTSASGAAKSVGVTGQKIHYSPMKPKRERRKIITCINACLMGTGNYSPLSDDDEASSVLRKQPSRSTKQKTGKSSKKATSVKDVKQSSGDVVKIESSCSSQSDVFSEPQISEGYSYLITDEVPESYWKELAEQRQSAIEKTLHQNECLKDRLVELQTENGMLQSVVKSAKDLASFIVDNLGDSVHKEDLIPLLSPERK